ncbi:MAG TPA: isochorismatase family cysteine hydrolase [Chloroflexota bacterium]|nr:isochorismatase family cysteine hydrolase [Chloroflexota bacterium]
MPQLPIDPSRSALILFDMLNHYLKPSDPALAREIAATGVVEHTARVLAAARAHGMSVFYTNGDHRADGRDWIPLITDANMNLEPWPDGPQVMPHRAMVTSGTAGAQVVDELAPRPEDGVILKHRWSSFAGTHLDHLLRARGINTLLLCGGSTDVGIASTAYAARDLGYNLIILRDCCHTERPGAQDFFMDRIFPRMARVLNAADAVALIAAGADQTRAAGAGTGGAA